MRTSAVLASLLVVGVAGEAQVLTGKNFESASPPALERPRRTSGRPYTYTSPVASSAEKVYGKKSAFVKFLAPW